jgi:hypothetical protein
MKAGFQRSRQTLTQWQTFLKFTQRHCCSMRQRCSAAAGAAYIADAQVLVTSAKAIKVLMTFSFPISAARPSRNRS